MKFDFPWKKEKKKNISYEKRQSGVIKIRPRFFKYNFSYLILVRVLCNVILIKIPVAFLKNRSRTRKLKICMEAQKTPNSQSNLEKEK